MSQQEPLEEQHACWAANIKRALEQGQTLSQADVPWLLNATGTKLGEHSTIAMCDMLMKRWVVIQVTERLKQ